MLSGICPYDEPLARPLPNVLPGPDIEAVTTELQRDELRAALDDTEEWLFAQQKGAPGHRLALSVCMGFYLFALSTL